MQLRELVHVIWGVGGVHHRHMQQKLVWRKVAIGYGCPLGLYMSKKEHWGSALWGDCGLVVGEVKRSVDASALFAMVQVLLLLLAVHKQMVEMVSICNVGM